MKKIAVISDTHNMVRDKVKEICQDADYIIHAGDVTNEKALTTLNNQGDLTIVKGNCDKHLDDLPENREIEIAGKRIYIVHNKKDIPEDLSNIDIVIFGHSHQYVCEEKDGILYLNPGSAGPRRFGRNASLAILTIDEETGRMDVEKVDLAEEAN